MALFSKLRRMALTAAIASALLMRELLCGSAGNHRASFLAHAEQAAVDWAVAQRSPGLRCAQSSPESRVMRKASNQIRLPGSHPYSGRSIFQPRGAVRLAWAWKRVSGSREKSLWVRAGVGFSHDVRRARTHVPPPESAVPLLIAPSPA